MRTAVEHVPQEKTAKMSITGMQGMREGETQITDSKRYLKQ